jgi:hypothetical protein
LTIARSPVEALEAALAVVAEELVVALPVEADLEVVAAAELDDFDERPSSKSVCARGRRSPVAPRLLSGRLHPRARGDRSSLLLRWGPDAFARMHSYYVTNGKTDQN